MSEFNEEIVEVPPVPPAAGAPASAGSKDLPRSILVAAGLASLDGVLSVVLLALWSFSPETALATLQAMSGFALILGLAPILVGGWILDRSRKIEGGIQGVAWARWAILAGGLLTTVSILIPLTAALSRLTSGALPE